MINHFERQSKASDIVAAVRIGDVYQGLGGKEVRRTGRDTWRAVAFWRGGDGLNVAGDDVKGCWHDHVADEGGGVVDLVVRVRGGVRQDALRWLGNFAGVAIDDTPFTAEDRERWLEERHDLEQNLPEARYWQRAAVNMAEDLLDSLKAKLFAPTDGDVVVGELQDAYRLLEYFRRLEGLALVTEFLWWVEHRPGMSAAMVRAAKAREKTEERALRAYLRLTNPERRKN